MLPETIEIDITPQQITSSRTFKLDLETNRLVGEIDNIESVIQSIEQILSIERNSYEIFNSSFGVEILKLIGKPYEYIVSETSRILTDALLQDDRILSVSNIRNERTGTDSMTITGQANTIFGEVFIAKEVTI